MKPGIALVVAAAILVHGWLTWMGQRYSFTMIDDSSLVRMNTLTGAFAICSVRGAFLSADRTIVCGPEGVADE